jgi:hypothetical protein
LVAGGGGRNCPRGSHLVHRLGTQPSITGTRQSIRYRDDAWRCPQFWHVKCETICQRK